jgi:hypothetical protein
MINAGISMANKVIEIAWAPSIKSSIYLPFELLPID